MCNITYDSCDSQIEGKVLSVGFVQQPVSEEEINLLFYVPQNLQIQQGFIEGVDMYMGKTPILFEDSVNESYAIIDNGVLDTNKMRVLPAGYYNALGTTFLGSCNLAKMKWRLVVNTIDENNVSQQFLFTFETVNN